MDSGAGRILIVDDDAALLKLMGKYLVRLGYQVDVCGSAAEAWALVEADPSRYASAMVDLKMPGMPGEELLRRILHLHAAIRVVAVSGDPSGLSGLESLDGSRVSFLQKPFAPAELADALK